MVKQYAGDKVIKVATAALVTIFGLIVFHAPLSVFFGQFTAPLLIKSWKEIILVFTLLIVIIIAWRLRKFTYFSRDLLLRLMLFYAVLHVGYLFVFDANESQKIAGLAIDLRYMLFFVLIFCLVNIKPGLRSTFLKVGVVSGALSVCFAAMQALVLPHDILKYIGYSKDTIMPFLTVDKNSDFIRINGTLRGPNPLGAYIMTVLSLLITFAVRLRGYALHKKGIITFSILSLVALWASFSRSAWLGTAISLGIIIFIRYARRFQAFHWLMIGAVLLLTGAAFFAAKDSYFVQNVIVHSNPSDSENFNSNEGHAVSLESSFTEFARQPFGEGVGTTGSASLLGKQPLIIENQYLFVAHETGWLGLSLFMTIFGGVLSRLYKNRDDWLSLGVFASGVGLAVIGLIQPVFADDTVSLVWWGLAAIALASYKAKGKIDAV